MKRFNFFVCVTITLCSNLPTEKFKTSKPLNCCLMEKKKKKRFFKSLYLYLFWAACPFLISVSCV